MINIILLIFGFIILIKGADGFVSGASSIAMKLKVPSILIGLTIVSIGTSAPEAAISIGAALNNQPDMVLGNVIGSNILNTALTIGVCALFFKIKIPKTIVRQELPISILASLIMLLMISNIFGTERSITRIEGILLLLLFSLFLINIFRNAKSTENNYVEVDNEVKRGWFMNIFITILGLIGIVVGGELVVEGATRVAIGFGMSQALVGLTIIAVGTGLPELVTSLTAVFKQEIDMAIGNVIGSNIFNILLVLGLTSSITPISVDSILIIDAIVMTSMIILVYLFAKYGKFIGRMHGTFLLLTYILYTAYIIMRN